MPKIVDHDARRRDFIAAAYATIMEQGLANTNLRAVAKKAGYTTGALVHYFADKEELIREALDYFGTKCAIACSRRTSISADAPHCAKPWWSRCPPISVRHRVGAFGWRCGITPKPAATCAMRNAAAIGNGSDGCRRCSMSRKCSANSTMR
ncbi:MAG: TetR/AcrR family transcriptional regulator [Gammaproteobacteria bacterium]|nr:TetR/AcrR family transcriptional regulator [Gammaproteobacteria bacterium]